MSAVDIKSDNRKYKELEGIRGLAALLVVIFHIPIWNPVFENNFIRNSYLMVDLFFVLSGFIIGTSYRKISTPKAIIRFQFLRFGRLYPIHFIILLTYMLLELIKYLAVTRYGALVRNEPFNEGIFITFLQHLFLVQAIIGKGDSFNVPAWSISVEFYTYMLFGIITLICGNKYKLYVYVLLSIFSLIILIVKPNVFSYSGSEELFRCFAGFFIGCIASSIKIKVKNYISPNISMIIFIIAIIFISIKKNNSNYDVIIYFISILLIMSLVMTEKSFLKSFLSTKYLVFLGSISYSIYMSHYIIIRLFDMSLRRLFGFPVVESNAASVVELNTLQAILIAITLLLMTIFVSFLLYKFVENPLRNRARQFAFTKL